MSVNFLDAISHYFASSFTIELNFKNVKFLTLNFLLTKIIDPKIYDPKKFLDPIVF